MATSSTVVPASRARALREDAATHVAAIMDTAQVSGPGRQLAALAVSLAAAGVQLHVVTFHRTGRPRSPYLDYLERAEVGYTVLEESGPLDFGLLPRLRRVLQDWAPDVVQTHGYKPTVLVWALRRSGATWPWLAFFHGGTAENAKVRLYTWLNNRLLGAADRAVVMSHAHLADFRHVGAKVRVVHNAALPLPRETPAPSSALSFGAEDGGAPRIGVVGRLSPEKGVDVFLQACAELTRRGVRYLAIVAGEGPERQALERLRDSLGLEPRVTFVGAMADVHALYEVLDLLVIPSRSEGLPNVLLEALRADLPVAATCVGAIPEVIDSPLAGVLVAPDAPEALADAIGHGLSLGPNPAAREARRVVVERFSIERRTKEHLALYRELAERRAGSPAAYAGRR
jgi:glycosyltransferase involved in cell wall biosynthesis